MIRNINDCVQGDTAVVFPCSMFNVSSGSDGFCFHYVSTSSQGSVHTVQSRCLGAQQAGNYNFTQSLTLSGAWYWYWSKCVTLLVYHQVLTSELSCKSEEEDYNSPENH